MTTTPEHDAKIAKITFASVYPHYLNKVLKKGRTELELLEVIEWLTGFNSKEVEKFIQEKNTFSDFIKQAKVNPNAKLITGVICGYRVEEITTELTRNIRYLDKLVDELAKGKSMDKILRK